MDARTWTECHVLAFEFFKGATKRIALDNLKSGVLKADIYDPAFNRSYAEMASHYGVLIDPCRSNHPKDKPRVERQVPYVRDSYWRGREFGSLKQMENEALRWCLSVAGQRIHGTTRQHPLEHFEREERSTLLLLPPTQWESVAWQTAKIGRDSHATVARTLYSVPFKFIGKTLDVRISDKTVQFYLGTELVKTHVRTTQRRQTDPGDLPAEKIAFYARNPKWCLDTALKLGPSVYSAVEQILSVNTLYNLRQSQAIIRLSDKYGALRLNAASERALCYGDPRYKTVKNILEKGLDCQSVASGGAASELPAFLHGTSAFGPKE